VRKMFPSCLLLCLWREKNDKSFENREKTFEEIKFLFFNTLYAWTTVFVFSLVISYNDFILFFVPTSFF
jgi:hypothetical protein